jgi:hypothetical protein
MAARRGGYPSGARLRAEETPSLADARAMDGRVEPGHDEVSWVSPLSPLPLKGGEGKSVMDNSGACLA